MKKLAYMLAAAAIILAGCAKEQIAVELQPASRTVHVTAGIDAGTQTRTTFYDGTWSSTSGYGFKVKWAVGDTISVLCWQGDDTQWGTHIGKANGEIIYTLTATDISADGRIVNFNFNIPTQITDGTKDINVLLTYLGNANYGKDETTLEPWLYASLSFTYDDPLSLDYVTNATPMTLRRTIAAGWNSNTLQAVFDGTFKHLATLFAVQLKNNTTAPIHPSTVDIIFSGGSTEDYLMQAVNPITKKVYIDPMFPSQQKSLYFTSGKEPAIAPGESFVFFLPVFIETSPTGIYIMYLDLDATSPLTTDLKTITKTLQAGKCYTVNVPVNNIFDGNGLSWNTETSVEAPYVYPQITFTTTSSRIGLYIDAAAADQSGVWIDLDNDGIKDTGESPKSFGSNEPYDLVSQTVTLYGKVTYLGCAMIQLIFLDVSYNTALIRLECSNNQLASLRVGPNLALARLDCFNNKISGDNMTALLNSLPDRKTTTSGELFIKTSSGDSNVATAGDIKIATDKNWMLKTM